MAENIAEEIKTDNEMTPEYNSQGLKFMTGSARRFQSVPDPGDYRRRPSLVDASTETNEKGLPSSRNPSIKRAALLELITLTQEYVDRSDSFVQSHNGNFFNLPNGRVSPLVSCPTVTSTSQGENIKQTVPVGTGNGNSEQSTNSEAGTDEESGMVPLDANNTRIPANFYESINWTSASQATRKLLRAIFDRNVLATHSMTFRPSPGLNDPYITSDIIHAVANNCDVSEQYVRNVIAETLKRGE